MSKTRHMEAASSSLWGEHAVEAGSGVLFRIGPLSLWIGRQGREWQMASRSVGDPQAPDRGLDVCREPPENLLETLARFVGSEEEHAIRLVPQLADRPVVARPALPMHLLPEEQVSLYLSSTVWVRVEAYGAPAVPPRLLCEIPTHRPSDTWFGPSTREGYLAYASRTAASLSMPDRGPRPARAITRVTLSNRSGALLPVERVALPARELDLVLAEDGQLWTDGVRVVVGPTRTAQFTIEPTAPDEAGLTRPIGAARDVHTRLTVVRALSALLD